MNEKRRDDLVQQVDVFMEVEKEGESKKENRKCLIVIEQNVMRNTLGECLDSKNRSGGKWKRIQKANQEEMGQRTEKNKENQELKN